jgi:hypothetical protein
MHSVLPKYAFETSIFFCDIHEAAYKYVAKIMGGGGYVVLCVKQGKTLLKDTH